MKLLCFDTETTGTPVDQAPLERQPHICQFAGIVYEYDNSLRRLEEIFRFDQLIKPPISMPQEVIAIHGITDAKVATAPIFAEVSEKIFKIFRNVDVAVAHNISFDLLMLNNEFTRYRQDLLDYLPDYTYDTMEETRELCKLPGKTAGNYKSPRLTELHQFLLGKDFSGTHNAIFDVEALGRCLKVLLDKNLFRPKKIEKKVEQGSLF